MIFYPIFCLQCQLSWISKVISEPCIRCGGRRTVNYKREILGDKCDMFVLQNWVSGVGCKMQSILISGLRAPDQYTKNTKKCIRWLRSKCQIDADPKKQSYMETVTIDDTVIDAAMDELEYCAVHYVHHFADSMAVLGYHHPSIDVCRTALKIHELVAVELFHFHPETRDEFLIRHEDKI